MLQAFSDSPGEALGLVSFSSNEIIFALENYQKNCFKLLCLFFFFRRAQTTLNRQISTQCDPPHLTPQLSPSDQPSAPKQQPSLTCSSLTWVCEIKKDNLGASQHLATLFECCEGVSFCPRGSLRDKKTRRACEHRNCSLPQPRAPYGTACGEPPALACPGPSSPPAPPQGL